MHDKRTNAVPLIFVSLFFAVTAAGSRAQAETAARTNEALRSHADAARNTAANERRQPNTPANEAPGPRVDAQPGDHVNEAPPQETVQAGSVPSHDANFIMKAANGGRAEVELAKLAIERASSKSVKEHARRMLDDHGKANARLREIASEKKIPLPDQLTGVHRNLVEQLRAEDQADFDEAYMQAQVGEHKAAVALFRVEKDKTADPALREFAANQLPVLEKHLEEALTIADGVVQGDRNRNAP